MSEIYWFLPITHLSKIISDLANFSILASGVYNTSTLSPDTATSFGCTRHSVIMSNNSEDLNADKSMDASETGFTGSSAFLVMDTPDAEPGSKALIGKGLPA